MHEICGSISGVDDCVQWQVFSFLMKRSMVFISSEKVNDLEKQPQVIELTTKNIDKMKSDFRDPVGL